MNKTNALAHFKNYIIPTAHFKITDKQKLTFLHIFHNLLVVQFDTGKQKEILFNEKKSKTSLK